MENVYSEGLAKKFAKQVKDRCKMKGISLNELSLNVIPHSQEEKEAARKYISRTLNANKIPPSSILYRIGGLLAFDISDYIWDDDSDLDIDTRRQYLMATVGLDEIEREVDEEHITSLIPHAPDYSKYIDIGEPYETLKMTDNTMRGCYFPKNTHVIYATDYEFKKDGGLYCCLTENKKYIRRIYHYPEQKLYGLVAAGGYNRHLAPVLISEEDVVIIGRVLAHYMIAEET